MIRRIPNQQPASYENTKFTTNPLVASVLRENVAIVGERAQIALWPNWPSLLEEVHAFGQTLSISRNSHAVLGRMIKYPHVLCAPCGHCGGSPDGSMEYYFSTWARAIATVEEQPGGWLYAVEFQDRDGDTLHKVCLTPESDFGTFVSWVELNQATSNEEQGFRRGGCGESEEPGLGENVILLREGGLRNVLSRMIEEGMRAQFVVGNDGMVQGADLTPRHMRENDQWIFFSEDGCGVHLRVGRLAEVCLQNVRWLDGSHWVLKAYEPEGRLACVMAPPREGGMHCWDDFLWDTTSSFHTHP